MVHDQNVIADSPQPSPNPRMVAEAFGEVLSRADYPTHQTLMAAGGTSMHAIRIARRLSRLTGVRVPVGVVLENAESNQSGD